MDPPSAARNSADILRTFGSPPGAIVPITGARPASRMGMGKLIGSANGDPTNRVEAALFGCQESHRMLASLTGLPLGPAAF